MLEVNNLLNRGIFNIPLLLREKYIPHFKCCQQFLRKYGGGKCTTAIFNKHYGKQETKDNKGSKLLPLMRRTYAL